MGKIPKKLNDELNQDPDYTVCMMTGEPGRWGDPLQRHHNLIFAEKQVQEKFAILAIKRSIHDRVSDPFIKARLDWIMLNRATEGQLLRYSKAEDLFIKKANLNKAFGVWSAPLVSKIMY